MLRQLIEDTYAANGNRSVILISLSMGSPYTSLFLSLQEQVCGFVCFVCLVVCASVLYLNLNSVRM